MRLESKDKVAIASKIAPLLDHILLDRLRSKDSETIAILSKYLAQIIDKKSEDNLLELSNSLQPAIGLAISKEIESNKSAMVDTLYPIIGGMIAKYVTQAIKEVIESINTKIENGLSLDRYKRKIKSKISGVSETELLLGESDETRIFSLFVIEKESGMLIVEAQIEEKEISDPHLVASMASAMKDFINDWVQDNQSQSEVETLSYGSASLYIESAGSVYMIAFLDSEPNYETRTNINAFFASLIKEYHKFFQSFDGDDSSDEVLALSKRLKEYLDLQKKLIDSPATTSTHNPVKYIAVVFAIVILIFLGYYANEQYDIYKLEKKVKRETGYSIKVEKRANRLIINGEVQSFSDATKISRIVRLSTDISTINNLHMSVLDIKNEINESKEKLTDFVNKKIKALEEKNLYDTNSTNKSIYKSKEETKKVVEKIYDRLISQDKEREKIHYELIEQQKEIKRLHNKFIKQEKRIEKIKSDFTISLKKKYTTIDKLKDEKTVIQSLTGLRENIISRLSKVFSSNKAFDSVDGSLSFPTGDLFRAGNNSLDEKTKKLIGDNFKSYLAVLLDNDDTKDLIKYIVIAGYSDSSANIDLNKKVSYDRAEVVKEYLLSLKINKSYNLKKLLLAKGLYDTELIFKNGVEDKEASRRVKIKFILAHDKIIRKMEEITK